MVPVTVGAPVTAAPGDTPKSPVIVVAPLLVTVVPARTAKGCAVPSDDCAHAGEAPKRTTARLAPDSTCTYLRNIQTPRFGFTGYRYTDAIVKAGRTGACSMLHTRPFTLAVTFLKMFIHES